MGSPHMGKRGVGIAFCFSLTKPMFFYHMSHFPISPPISPSLFTSLAAPFCQKRLAAISATSGAALAIAVAMWTVAPDGLFVFTSPHPSSTPHALTVHTAGWGGGWGGVGWAHVVR